MHSRAGSQVPFSSVNIGIPRNKYAALACKIFLEEYERGLGKGEQPIFPNICFRLKKGINTDRDDPYRYLTDIAIRVAAKRMNPTFMNIDSSLNKPFVDKGIMPAIMGCRTYIGANLHGPEGPMNRGNNFPVSINLPRIGIESKKSWDRFYKILDMRMDLCADELLYRYDVTKRLKVKDLPFVAGQHLMEGSKGLSPDDSIEPILKNGTLGIGFIGLAETMIAMTGHHHGEGEQYWDKAYEIMKHMRDRIDGYKTKYNLNFTFYATPAEGLSGRFVKIDQKRYGVIPGVTDKDYYTNSFHIPVKFPISAYKKGGFEAPFHKLCNAGMISYFELDGGDCETRAKFIDRSITMLLGNTDINYWGYNFHIRYCKDCGTELLSGEQHCSNCGSTNIQGVSRVTGYLSLDERFTPGKVAERKDRKTHN
jgi:ribonucleoside-triphosphate reductase